jgi:predicted ATPase
LLDPTGATWDHAAVAVAVPLLGRDAEVQRLEGLLDAVAERGSALLVLGEAGVGKSALIAAAAQRAAGQGMLVLKTSGVQSESQLPFAGLHQLLQPILGLADELPAP